MSSAPPLAQDARKGFIVFCLVAVAVYAGSTGLAILMGRAAQSSQTHFAHLAHAFLHGRLDVDPAQAPALTELVPYEGKHYVVYPPMPAVLLLPFVALFGPGFPTAVMSIGLAGLCVGMTYLLLRRLGHSPQVSGWVTVVFGFGSGFWFNALKGASWGLAHVVAIAFLLLALLEAYGRRRALLIGIWLGAATLARLPVVLATPFFLYIGSQDEPRKGRRALWLLAGLGIFVGLNMAYNWARYHTVVDIGYYRIPGVLDEPWYRQGIFHLSYLPRNLYAALFQPPMLVQEFPYLVPTTFGLGLFFTTPAFLLMFLAPGNRQTWMVAAAALLVAVPGLLHGWPGGEQYGYRFSLDYTPFLLMLTACGMRGLVSGRARALVVLSCLAALWGLGFARWIAPAWLFPLEGITA